MSYRGFSCENGAHKPADVVGREHVLTARRTACRARGASSSRISFSGTRGVGKTLYRPAAGEG